MPVDGGLKRACACVCSGRVSKGGASLGPKQGASESERDVAVSPSWMGGGGNQLMVESTGAVGRGLASSW